MPHDNKREINKQLGTICSISLQTMQNLPKVSVMVVTAARYQFCALWLDAKSHTVSEVPVNQAGPVLCFDYFHLSTPPFLLHLYAFMPR